MIHHVILWKLKDSIEQSEKNTIKANIKHHLEALNGVVPGLQSLRVITEGLPSSNADVMLDSILESEEALAGYQTHPKHVEAAGTYVRPYTEIRLCMDYRD